MNNHPALLALEKALTAESSTPCTWREDRENYIREQTQELREYSIESPYAVQAVASEWAQQYCEASGDTTELIAVTRRDETWLLFNPATEEFAKAFGKENQSEPLSLLGFASGDALAEWLG